VVYSGWSPLSRGVGASSWHRRSTCLFTNYRGLIWFDMSSGENGWKPWYVLVMFFFRRHLKRWRKNKTCHSFLYPFIPIWIHPTCNFWHSEDSELVDLVRHGSVSYWCGDLTEQAVVSTTFQYDLTAWFHVPQRLEFGMS
jgi:hypothetical protein